VLEFTKNGIRTKQFQEEEWSKWRGKIISIFLKNIGRSPTDGSCIELLFILSAQPEGYPNPIILSPLSEEKCTKLKQSFGTVEKVKDIVDFFLKLPLYVIH